MQLVMAVNLSEDDKALLREVSSKDQTGDLFKEMRERVTAGDDVVRKLTSRVQVSADEMSAAIDALDAKETYLALLPAGEVRDRMILQAQTARETLTEGLALLTA